MIRGRTRLRAWLLAACVAATGLCAGSSTAAAADYEQWYCGVTVSVGYECKSAGLHSWYWTSGIALGNYAIGTYMWNAHNGVIRGGHIAYSSNGVAIREWNRTNDQWYNARVFNNEPYVAVYIDGWARAA